MIVVPRIPPPSARSANLRANRRIDTKPERLIRTRLHAFGYRYRVDLPIRIEGRIAARPDVAFTRVRIAVFIDGCFWHGCPVHGKRDWSRNGNYWSAKIARNHERDLSQTHALVDAGWAVLRFWEHESPDVVTRAIADAVDSARAAADATSRSGAR